jgi:hypothetical protein
MIASGPRGRKSAFRDSMSAPQLVFLPRAAITGSAAILSPHAAHLATRHPG